MDLIMIKVEVSDEFQSVGWNDDYIIMLVNIVKEDIGKQCIENNNIRCKHPVKRTGVEKMCDVAIIFNLPKHIEKQTTLKEILFDSLYFVIDDIFSELKEMDKLHLKANQS